MATDIDPDDILVTVGHPHGDVEVPLAQWIERGPGPRRFVQLVSARRKSTGEPIPLDDIDDPWRRPPPTYPGPNWQDEPQGPPPGIQPPGD